MRKLLVAMLCGAVLFGGVVECGKKRKRSSSLGSDDERELEEAAKRMRTEVDGNPGFVSPCLPREELEATDSGGKDPEKVGLGKIISRWEEKVKPQCSFYDSIVALSESKPVDFTYVEKMMPLLTDKQLLDYQSYVNEKCFDHTSSSEIQDKWRGVFTQCVCWSKYEEKVCN